MTGPVYDAGHFNLLIYSGAFFVVFGQMMLSLCHTYWQALLAQAVCIGLGAGLLYVPSVAILSTYFNKRIALVVGIAASGSSLGMQSRILPHAQNEVFLRNTLLMSFVLYRWCHLPDCLPSPAANDWFCLDN